MIIKIIRLSLIIVYSASLVGCALAKDISQDLAEDIAWDVVCEPRNVDCEGPYKKYEKPDDRPSKDLEL